MERTVTYLFELAGGGTWRYDLRIDKNGVLVPGTEGPERPWTKLEYQRCPNCPLSTAHCQRCPVARNIDRVVEASKDTLSYTRSKVTVITPERIYVKECATQEGLRSLFGYIMAISGCAHFDWLRPLARFHLPFADLDETLFRVLSVQLLEGFFTGEHTDFTSCCNKITERYQALQQVNHAFITRIRNYCKADANKNAIAALDTFVQIFELQAENNFESLRKYFSLESVVSKKN